MVMEMLKRYLNYFIILVSHYTTNVEETVFLKLFKRTLKVAQTGSRFFCISLLSQLLPFFVDATVHYYNDIKKVAIISKRLWSFSSRRAPVLGR